MYTLQAWAGIRLSLHHSAHSLELQVEVEKQMMLHKMDQTFLTLNVFFFFFKKQLLLEEEERVNLSLESFNFSGY